VTATDPAGNATTNTYQISVSGSSKSYSYDANGNLTQKVDGADTWGYEWYADDRLARVTKNSVEQARFVYDGHGRRYQKIAGGVTTTYAYDGEDILRESLSSGTIYRYAHGPGVDKPLARRDQSGDDTFYHADHLGSIVKTTNSSGATASTRRYDLYGNLEQGATESGYTFTGREHDPETGLYYYRARYYDPQVGRFLSEDPSGLAGGINLFVYVLNRPVTSFDPFGLKQDPYNYDADPETDPCKKDRQDCGVQSFLWILAFLIACFGACSTIPTPLLAMGCFAACWAGAMYLANLRLKKCDTELENCQKQRDGLAPPPTGKSACNPGPHPAI
jgi:RHS repeat-associated protein